MIVKVRVAFHVSWANRLQLEKISARRRSSKLINASGTVLVRTFGKELKRYCTRYGTSPGFRIETAKIKPKLELVCANDAGNVVSHVDLLLQVVSQLAA